MFLFHKWFTVVTLLFPFSVIGKVYVVSSLPDQASIASYIGGDKVTVSSIVKGGNNPHNIEVFPSQMALVLKAKVYLKNGLGLDYWADEIINGSRNNSLIVIDCSKNIKTVEKPTEKINASKGDVHPYGNPHYWLNPLNAEIVAKTITDAFQRVDSKHAQYYQDNLIKFIDELTRKRGHWQSAMKTFKNTQFISYHSSWSYFADAFGLTIAALIEPYPGIPPTGNHLSKLVKLIKDKQIKLLIREPYFSIDAPQFLNRQTGIRIVTLSPSCSNVDSNAYLSHIDEIVRAFTEGDIYK